MDKLYIEDIVSDVKRDFQERRSERSELEAVWQLCMNFVMGNQFAYINALGDVENGDSEYAWQEKEVFNHIASIVESRLSKLNRVRPKMSVRPASNDDDDVRTSRVATKLLEGAWQKLDLGEAISRATLWSEVTGTVFYKVAWDNGSGKVVGQRDGATVREGDIRIDVCPPYEIYPSSLFAETIDEQSSIIQAKAMHVDDIFARWGKRVKATETDVIGFDGSGFVGSYGIRSAMPSLKHSVKKDHALIIERYTRPSPDRPQGELAIVADDELLYYGPLPYANGVDGERSFPFVKQECIKNPGCFFGTSVVERCIPIQRAYNSVKNRKHEFLNRISMGVLAVEDGSVDINSLEEDGLRPGKILTYRQGANPPALMNPGSVPVDFNYEEDKLLSEFISISGVSEIMRSSSIPSSITSGTALRLLLEQDDTRLSVTAEFIRSAAKKMGQHILRLYKQFATQPRLLRAVGSDGEVEVISFSASDIGCDDVAFDTENELNSSLANRQNMVFELLRAGLLFDENGRLSDSMRYKILDVMGYGGWEITHDRQKLHVARAQKENLEAKSVPLEVNELDDHKVHIEEHSRYLLGSECEKAEAKAPGLKDKLAEHIRLHKTHLKLNEEANNGQG